jgi:hypothetical protein
MTARKAAGAEPVAPAPPSVYNAFLRDVDLASVRMIEGAFSARVAQPPVSKSRVDIQFDGKYSNAKGGFEATATFTFTFLTSGDLEPIGTVRAVFALKYRTALPMSDEIWMVFLRNNLRLNAWPYAREFAQTATLRMDWPKFTLPVANSTRFGTPNDRKAEFSAKPDR